MWRRMSGSFTFNGISKAELALQSQQTLTLTLRPTQSKQTTNVDLGGGTTSSMIVAEIVRRLHVVRYMKAELTLQSQQTPTLTLSPDRNPKPNITLTLILILALFIQHKTRVKTRPDQRRQDQTRQDQTRQDKTRQDKTRQDKTRQDKTRQDMT